MVTLRYIKFAGISLLLLLLAGIYSNFDPAAHNFFPACPFHSLTGLLCPGCGSQRALHHLLNLQVQSAFSQNPLLVISLPYILACAVIDRVNNPSNRLLMWRQFFFGRNAIIVVLLAIISFWILRNL